ncbi:MAG: hypothetical protein WDM79_01175 [Terricaulis sp.]
MSMCVTTVAFAGLEARRVDVQVQIAGGVPGIVIVGLGDKAIAESRDVFAPPSPALASPFPPAASSSIWRLPIFRKRARIMTCRSRSP